MNPRQRVSLRDVSIGRKFLVLSSVVLLAFATVCAFQIITLGKYKVGGPTYGTLKSQTDAVQGLTTLLSEVNALQATLYAANANAATEGATTDVEQTRTHVEEIGDGISARFAAARSTTEGELLRSAEATWKEYFEAVHEQLRDFKPARFQAFLTGAHERRYARLISEVEDVNNSLRLRTSDIERATSASVDVANRLVLIVEAILAVILVLVLRTIARTITVPLKALVHAAHAVGIGDLTVKLPAKTGDELGQLAGSLGDMVAQLRRMTLSFRDVATQLGEAVKNMASVASEQVASVNRQGVALRETQVTAQEIRETSKSAATRAARLLHAAEKASDVGQAGGTALKASLDGIESIKTGIDEIASRMRKLGDRAQHLGMITETVKDLTDQSQVLALSASIEAVRSGEHGKGFAIVAREMRALTDQSALATKQIKAELEATGSALRESVEITQHGREGMDKGLAQIEVSAERLQELATMVEESSAGVREIATAVTQQDEGVAQIFEALTEMTATMGQTETNIEKIHGAITVLEKAAGEARSAAEIFKLTA